MLILINGGRLWLDGSVLARSNILLWLVFPHALHGAQSRNRGLAFNKHSSNSATPYKVQPCSSILHSQT